MKNTIIQFIKFGIVGVSNTLVSYILNILVIMGLKNKNCAFDYVIANMVSFFLSVLWSFYWNEKLVFTDRQDEYKCSKLMRVIKMYICYGFTGIILNNVLSFVWIEILGCSKVMAPLINIPINVPINYFLNKKWTFEE